MNPPSLDPGKVAAGAIVVRRSANLWGRYSPPGNRYLGRLSLGAVLRQTNNYVIRTLPFQSLAPFIPPTYLFPFQPLTRWFGAVAAWSG